MKQGREQGGTRGSSKIGPRCESELVARSAVVVMEGSRDGSKVE